jgi:hypothetical protein
MFKATMLAPVLASILAVTSLAPANAMEFSFVTSYDIEMEGNINLGDAAKLKATLAGRPRPSFAERFYFHLNSPGGNVAEALDMAEQIAATRGSTTVVSFKAGRSTNGAVCASACFFLFAAGQYRQMATNAAIGVHSVADAYGESYNAMASTVILARLAHDLRVPDAVIGKMVATKPNQITWLDNSDLAAMHVTVFPAPLSLPPSPHPECGAHCPWEK